MPKSPRLLFVVTPVCCASVVQAQPDRLIAAIHPSPCRPLRSELNSLALSQADREPQDGRLLNFATMKAGALIVVLGFLKTVSACSYLIAAIPQVGPPATSQFFSQASGTSQVAVTTDSGCPWTASSDSNWLTITAGASGSGSGTVTYNVGANPARLAPAR